MAIKEKMREEEYDRVSREMVRWKERYEWLEKERGDSLQIIEHENMRLREEIMGREAKRMRQPVYEMPLASIQENRMSSEEYMQQFSQKSY